MSYGKSGLALRMAMYIGIDRLKTMHGYFNIKTLIELAQKFGIDNLFSTRNHKELIKRKFKCLTCDRELTSGSAWTVKWVLPFDDNVYCKRCAKLQKVVEAL